MSAQAVAGSATPDAYRDITAVLSMYLDGLYHSDTTRLRAMFHPRAQYACATDGTLTYLTMEEYFPIVDQRPSPVGESGASTPSSRSSSPGR